MTTTLTRAELPDLWRKAQATGKALGEGYALPYADEDELDRLERADDEARRALRTFLQLIGLTNAEIDGFPL